jgi:hypothetical protein
VKKTILVTAAALCFGIAFAAAASDQANKASSQTTTGAGQNPQIQTPFKLMPSGNYVFVINGGTADWTGPLDVNVKCTPVAPTTSCGSNFPGGTLHKHYNKGEFPKGHGQTPVSAPSGNSVIIAQGGGYDAVFMGLPVGKYKITATAGTNSCPETNIQITVPPPGSPTPVAVSPAVTFGVAPKNP